MAGSKRTFYQEFLDGIFNTHKQSVYNITIKQKSLVAAMCLKFKISRRYVLDLLKIFEDSDRIRTTDGEIEVLR